MHLLDNDKEQTGESVSSSTMLFHEIGHGYSHFFDKNYGKRYLNTLEHWTNEEEKFNIFNYENPLARKKGEGIRYNHHGEYFKVSNIFEY